MEHVAAFTAYFSPLNDTRPVAFKPRKTRLSASNKPRIKSAEDQREVYGKFKEISPDSDAFYVRISGGREIIENDGTTAAKAFELAVGTAICA